MVLGSLVKPQQPLRIQWSNLIKLTDVLTTTKLMSSHGLPCGIYWNSDGLSAIEKNLTTHVQHVLKGCCLKNNLARQKLGIIEVNEVGRGSLSLPGSVKMRASKALAETQRLGASTERQVALEHSQSVAAEVLTTRTLNAGYSRLRKGGKVCYGSQTSLIQPSSLQQLREGRDLPNKNDGN